MHTTIECSEKHKTIYIPFQWITLVRCAKISGKPYEVFELSYEDFLDFKQLVENSQFNWKTSTDSKVIKWNSVKEITTSYKTPNTINIRYNLNSTSTVTMNMLAKKKRGRFQERCIPLRVYKEKLPVTN